MPNSRLLPILTVFCLLSFAQSLPAQSNDDDDNNPSDEVGRDRFWELSLPEGNHYMVALDRISSISKSSYILSGGVLVTEINIDTAGSALCRIYQITPITDATNLNGAKVLTERARQGLNRVSDATGSSLVDMVKKEYPVTTHAKTIEYQIRDLETLDQLYQSLTTAWSVGQGRRFTIEK